jgi:hypothetical protein
MTSILRGRTKEEAREKSIIAYRLGLIIISKGYTFLEEEFRISS